MLAMAPRRRLAGVPGCLPGSAILAVSIVFAMVLAGAAGRARAEPVKLRFAQAYSALQSVFALPLLVAERQGFFVREGLAFSMLPVTGGGTDLVKALHNDTADIAHVAMPFLIQAALDGSDAVAIAAEFNNPIYSLLAKPEIETFADLRGRLIGVAAETGSITLSIRRLLRQHGLQREDFRSVFVDGTPARLTCLTVGDCDAVILGQPQDFTAVRRGFRLLGLSTDAVPAYVYTVSAVRRSWAAANKEALVRYVRALAGALAFIRDRAQREVIVRTLVDTTGLSEASARATLELYFEPDRGVLPIAGEIDIAGVEEVISLMAEGGVLKAPLPKPGQFVDLQYLNAAGIR